MNKVALILGPGTPFKEPLSNQKELYLSTPYGTPSTKIITGTYNNMELAILYRHGKDSNLPAFNVNYKANLFALHELNCSHVVATSLCGSLQEEIETGEFVVFDQFIDLTKHRELTCNDEVAIEKLNHSALNKPFSDEIRNSFIEAAVIKGITVHTKGTVIAVDGPRQSTRAESNLFRSWKADVVNTTTAPEAILAHELKMEYGAISLCTYFDSWRTDILPASFSEKQEILEDKGDDLYALVIGALNKLKN
jgi:5'-methylthioadenosine phosphorylase